MCSRTNYTIISLFIKDLSTVLSEGLQINIQEHILLELILIDATLYPRSVNLVRIGNSLMAIEFSAVELYRILAKRQIEGTEESF